MSSIKYLSPSGLTEVWGNIKAYIASKVPSKIVTGLSIKGRTITYTNSDGTTGTLTTQDTDTTYTNMTGATASVAGTAGLVPAPSAGKQVSFLRGDGTWVVPTNTTYASMSASEATTGTATTARTISAKTLHDKINSSLSTYATKTELNNGLATKANDSTVAHKTYAETISGAWSFTSTYGLQTTLIYPNVDNTYNLGESDKRYKNAYATTFHGNLVGNASSATKAVQDGSGAVIANTYATKTELTTKANDTDVVHKSGTETIVGTKKFANQMYMGSGGTGYGQISAKDNNSILRLYGGTTPSTGANLDLYGEGENGTFALRARTSDKILALYGKTDGTLKWDNNEILTIVNGVTLNTAQTITGQKLFTDEVLIKSLTVSRVPSSDMWGRGITFQDSTGKRTGFISNYFFTNGNMSMRFFGSSTTYDTKELFSLNWKTDETVTANINGVPLLTEQTGVTTVTAQTITGAKTFVPWQTFSNGLNVKWITGNKERKALFLYATMNDKYQGYGATLQLLSEELNGGFRLIAKDKTDTNVKALAGQSNGVLTWGANNVLTDANQIMMCKNLSGTSIASGGIVDCGTGNGKLQGWYINNSGLLALSGTLVTGKWKNVSVYLVRNTFSGMFVKV